MAEEQRYEQQQQPGSLRLCANNCGVFGNPTTLDLCSKCYKNYRNSKKQRQISKAKIPVEKTSIELKSESESASLSESSPAPSPAPAITPEEPPAAVRPNRCAECRRRVGLTGFTCRCGTMFCGTHRYSEVHRCTFDFKKMGKDAIAKANPVVKAEKLHKI